MSDANRRGRDLSHFFRRTDPKKGEARREYGDYPLHQSKPGRRRFSIILDNEA
jgi:hypothetical protein